MRKDHVDFFILRSPELFLHYWVNQSSSHGFCRDSLRTPANPIPSAAVSLSLSPEQVQSFGSQDSSSGKGSTSTFWYCKVLVYLTVSGSSCCAPCGCQQVPPTPCQPSPSPSLSLGLCLSLLGSCKAGFLCVPDMMPASGSRAPCPHLTTQWKETCVFT